MRLGSVERRLLATIIKTRMTALGLTATLGLTPDQTDRALASLQRKKLVEPQVVACTGRVVWAASDAALRAQSHKQMAKLGKLQRGLYAYVKQNGVIRPFEFSVNYRIARAPVYRALRSLANRGLTQKIGERYEITDLGQRLLSSDDATRQWSEFCRKRVEAVTT